MDLAGSDAEAEDLGTPTSSAAVRQSRQQLRQIAVESILAPAARLDIDRASTPGSAVGDLSDMRLGVDNGVGDAADSPPLPLPPTPLPTPVLAGADPPAPGSPMSEPTSAPGSGSITARVVGFFRRGEANNSNSGNGDGSNSARLAARQPGLPPKSPEEEERHQRQIEELQRQHRQRLEREARDRERVEKKRLAKEARVADALRAWNEDVLPAWDRKRESRRVRTLYWSGIPASVRSKAWPLAIGNDLNIAPELYAIFGKSAAEQRSSRTLGEREEAVDKRSTVTLISLDLPRTFPGLSIFGPGGPCHDQLRNVLEAYVCFRPDVGYVQGMSFLAAVLLLNVDEYMAFQCLANMLNRPLFLAFFKMDVPRVEQRLRAFDALFREHLPTLHKYFSSQGITGDMFLVDWVLTLFTKALPLDIAARIWDVYVFEGEVTVFRAALGILRHLSSQLLNLPVEEIVQRLIHAPVDLDENLVLESIQAVTLTGDRYASLVADCS